MKAYGNSPTGLPPEDNYESWPRRERRLRREATADFEFLLGVVGQPEKRPTVMVPSTVAAFLLALRGPHALDNPDDDTHDTEDES